MKPQKTLHVLHTESVYSRGGEKYLFELLRRVAHDRVVHLYLHKISPQWKSKYVRAGIPVTDLWRPPRFFWLLLPLTLCVNYFQLKRLVKNRDVVFATNFPMNYLAVIVSRKTICHCFEPLAIFYDPIRIASLSWFSRISVAVAKYMYAHLDVWAYKSSAIFTALGPTVEPYIMETYGRRPDLYLPNGVDTVFFSPTRHRVRKTATKSIGHSTDYTIFKGTDDFLAALVFLKKTGLRFRAYISESISDDTIKTKYMKFIKETGLRGLIRFTGNISEKDFPGFYRSLDVFVYTGSPESAGGSTASLSVLESQACGTPVIRSGGDDHEILEGKTGLYINPHDHAGTANTIASYLRLPVKSRRDMQRACRAYITSGFSWKTTGQILLKTVQRLETI